MSIKYSGLCPDSAMGAGDDMHDSVDVSVKSNSVKGSVDRAPPTLEGPEDDSAVVVCVGEVSFKSDAMHGLGITVVVSLLVEVLWRALSVGVVVVSEFVVLDGDAVKVVEYVVVKCVEA